MYVCKYIQIHTNIIYTYKNLKATDHGYMSHEFYVYEKKPVSLFFWSKKRHICIFTTYKQTPEQ